jgi:hypothetical protein
MALLRVRYRTGDTDEWPVHERHDLQELFEALSRAFINERFVSFTVHARSGEEVEYGTVWLQMRDVMMWSLDNDLDQERLASWWQPDSDTSG